MAAAALEQTMKKHETIQARLLKSMESECFSACDLVVACSEQDRDGVLALSPMTVCEVIGNGVDTNYFQRPHSAVRATLPTVLFTGSFGYGPNAEAVLWFAKEVLPLIHREVDNCHFVVAGSRAFALRNAPELLDSRIQLVSDPDDMRPSFHRAWVVAVPLLVGGGTRLKILESMAMECPVVSTALGAEGIPLVNDRDAFIRDEPKAFAEGVIRLLRNEPLRQRISATALKFVQDHYDWKALTSGLGDVLDTLPGGHG